MRAIKRFTHGQSISTRQGAIVVTAPCTWTPTPAVKSLCRGSPRKAVFDTHHPDRQAVRSRQGTTAIVV
jgi:hypothetical protein